MSIFLGLPADLLAIPRLKADVEFRLRAERRLDRDFNSAAPDNRNDFNTRTRVGLTYDVNDEISARLQYEYSHDLFQAPSGNASSEASDLYQGYIQYRGQGLTAKLGRQTVTFGSGRLVDSPDWPNITRTFDGLRVSKNRWDAFGAKIGAASPHPTDARLYGVGYHGETTNVNFFYKHDTSAAGSVDVTTLNPEFVHQFGPLNVDAEGVVQRGKTGGKDQNAFAVNLRTTYTATPKLNVFAEGTLASGGGDAGTNRSVDILYPGIHKFYGNMDLFSWKNLRTLAIGATYAATEKLDVSTELSTNALYDASDAWYGSAGTPNKTGATQFVDATGLSGNDIGKELDFDAVYRLSPKTTLGFGLGAFFPGGFVSNISGESKTQIFGYFSYQLKF